MIIDGWFETLFLVVIFGMLGVILVGNFLIALRLGNKHPNLVGAIVGALLDVALIEVVPLIT